jgi:hypothetical protein
MQTENYLNNLTQRKCESKTLHVKKASLRQKCHIIVFTVRVEEFSLLLLTDN